MSISRMTMKLSAVLAVAGMVSTANAGDQLHLQSGVINTSLMTNTVNGQSQEYSNGYYIIQFKDIITAKDRKQLKSLGLKVLRYLPDDAYIVKGKAKAFAKADRLASVNTIMPYSSLMKVSLNVPQVSVFNKGNFGAYVVRAFEKTDLNNVVEQISSIKGASIVSAEDKTILVNIKNEDLNKLSSIQEVEYVQAYERMELQMMDLLDEENPQKPQQPQQPQVPRGDYTDVTGFEDGTQIMKMQTAWGRGFTGAGQVVTMADTGLDTGDLNTLVSDFSGVVGGYALGIFSRTWEDPMGHGTHVAGSVMSNGSANGGFFRGAAPHANLIAEGMWSKMMKNLTVPPQLSKLFQPAYNDGSRIHTNSWGNPRSMGRYDGMAVQVDEFVWKNPDFLILFAAGNSGIDRNKDGRIDEGSVSSPGTNKNGLTIGASENLVSSGGVQHQLGKLAKGEPWGVEPLASDTLSNNPNGIAAFSSRGPTTDGRIKPDLVAPGTNVISNCSHLKDASPLWGKYNNDYCYSGGTSMSTPLAAGAAAVMRQFLVNVHGLTNPSAAIVKAAMLHTADDLFPGQYGVGRGQELLAPGPNPHQGFGRINMDNGTNGMYQVVDNTKGVGAGEVVEFTIQGEFKKATLVYTDAPGSPSAGKALVNDLDLEVVTATGTYSANDHSNNSEQVILPALVGTATIRIKGTNVPQPRANGKLPFALVVSK